MLHFLSMSHFFFHRTFIVMFLKSSILSFYSNCKYLDSALVIVRRMISSRLSLADGLDMMHEFISRCRTAHDPITRGRDRLTHD